MAHGALGARLSCLLELNVIYTAEERRAKSGRAECCYLCGCV